MEQNEKKSQSRAINSKNKNATLKIEKNEGRADSQAGDKGKKATASPGGPAKRKGDQPGLQAPTGFKPAKDSGKSSSLPSRAGQNQTSQSVARLGERQELLLKVIPLGGLGEIGKNMTVIQYGKDIVVIDCGVMFPEDELLGIDLVIPDHTYLLDNRENVLAFLITHGHEDHIGAVPYILKDFEAPVYASRLTLGFLRSKFQEHKLKARLYEVRPRQTVTIGPFQVEFIRVAHSIPDSLAVAVHTPLGTVMMISDFKMDMSPIDGQLTDFGQISRLGQEGVLLLLADSTNAEREGFTPSEKTVGGAFDKIFLSAQGRIIITSFASNVHRIQQAIWSAARFGRKVAVVGRGMQNVTSIATELGYLEIPPSILIDVDMVNRLPANQVLIITTGSQGEPLSGLSRMSSGEHRQVQIVPGDLIIISANPIPGNERLVGRTVDNLFRQGASVIYERSEGVHVSGHANREELKVLLNLVKPKFFMPVHGEYRMLYKHALLAQEVGVDINNIFLLENGQVLEVNRRRCRIHGSVPSGRTLIDGRGIGDVGNTVLRERKTLSEAGIVLVNLAVSKKNGNILAGPEIFSRGFIFEKEYEHIIDEVRERVEGICLTFKEEREGKPGKGSDWGQVKNLIRSSVSRFLMDLTGRRPLVVTVLTEIN